MTSSTDLVYSHLVPELNPVVSLGIETLSVRKIDPVSYYLPGDIRHHAIRHHGAIGCIAFTRVLADAAD